ncbi:MAG: hypothetical protein J6A33_04110 [Alphaproteobacteria bacterium]|nr:hypothetical protein [Alphaproteobacteria bacterium]
MKRLYYYISAISVLVLGISGSVSAMIKFDVSATSGKVTETVSEWGGKAKKMMDENATLQTLITYGKAAKEAAANLQEMKNDAMQAVGDVTSAANQMKEDVNSTVGDVAGEVNGVAGTATGAVGNVTSKTQSAQEILKLQNEKKELEDTIEQEIFAQVTEITGKINALQQNNAALRQKIQEEPDKKSEYEASIVANESKIKELNEESQQISTNVKSQYSSQLSALDEQISAAKSKASEEAMGALSDNADKLKGLLGGDAAAEELNQTVDNNFIPADTPITVESRKKVMDYRKKVQALDTIKAVNAALFIKKDLDASNEQGDKTKEKADTSEGFSTKPAMGIQLKIDEIKALLKYTKLLMADMKMKTATDLAGMSEVMKLRNPDKDITSFNLDDYKYSKSDCNKKEGEEKKSLLDKAKDKYKQAKNIMSEAKEYGALAKEAMSVGKDVASSFSSGKRSGGSSGGSSSDAGYSGNTEYYNAAPSYSYAGEEYEQPDEAPAEVTYITRYVDDIQYDENGNPIEEEETEENEVAEKTEGSYEKEARTRAGAGVDADAMTQDEYEKAARAAGSAGVASDFRIDKKTSAVEKKDSGEEGELSAKPQVKASAVPQTSGRKSFGTAQVAVSAKAGEKK